MAYDDVLTRNDDQELAVRVVSATESATVVNPNDVYTRDTDGNLAIRTVGNGGSGGGAVDSVNGKTGVVVLDAEDVGALANTTKYVVNASWTIDPSTYVMTLQLKDQDGANIGTAQTIDLPLESVVVGGSYDSTNKNIVLTLNNGTTINVPVADLVSGLQSEITTQDPLSADLVDDTNTTHKFVSAAEKSTWNNKQDAISDLATIRSGAAAGATAIQSVKTINGQTIVGEGNVDIDGLPAQTGQAGKVLTTDGTDASWETPTTITMRTWGANE